MVERTVALAWAAVPTSLSSPMLLVSLLLLSATVIGVSFICSLTEAVLLSLNPLELRLQQQRGIQGASRWLQLKGRIERPIAAILVFNCLASTGLATLVGAIFTRLYGAEWLWVFSAGLTLAILFGAELAPKVIGVHHTARLAQPLLPVLNGMILITRPLLRLMEAFCEKLKPRTSGKDRSGSDHILDIITLVEAARAEQAIHNREETIIIHAATLSARRVRNTMVPAESVRFFDRRESLQTNVSRLSEKLHRSYPVSHDGSLDSVDGYVRVREAFVGNILSADGCADCWQEHIRPVLEVDASSSLTHLLAEFLTHREIAAIVKHQGRNIGWITLDNVTETLMGARA